MINVFETYDGSIQPPEEPDYMTEHADHCIEDQHHGSDEIYPRRKLEKFEAIEGFFPNQQTMLLNVESKYKQSLIAEFTYNVGKISREVSIDDIVRVIFIKEGKGLVELIGKISDIKNLYNTITLDFSENYEAKRFVIPITSLRFISNDLDEIPPIGTNGTKQPLYHHPHSDYMFLDKSENVYPTIVCNHQPQFIFEKTLYTKPIIN